MVGYRMERCRRYSRSRYRRMNRYNIPNARAKNGKANDRIGQVRSLILMAGRSCEVVTGVTIGL